MATTDRDAIKKFIGYMNGQSTQAQHCGYDGAINFYKGDALLQAVPFNYSNPGCRHFHVGFNNTSQELKMNSETADFIAALLQGKTHY
ncbi:MAG: hypothetical protein NVSMB7_14680 [Chitinophagaceae bacterium]